MAGGPRRSCRTSGTNPAPLARRSRIPSRRSTRLLRSAAATVAGSAGTSIGGGRHMRRLYAAPLPPRLRAAASPRRRLSRVGSRPSSARAAASSIASGSRSRGARSRRPPLRGSWIAAASMRTPMAIAQAATTYRSACAEMSFQTSSAMPIAVPATACQPSSLGPRERCRERCHTRQNASDQCVHRDDGDDGRQADVRHEHEAEEDGRDAVRCDEFPDAGKVMRSPSLAASSILLLTFDSKVSVGVDSVVIYLLLSGTSWPPRGPSARGRRALP